jgi:hypothetical protein
MAAATSMAERAQREERTSLLWLVYGQIAAMLAAFSLLVFLTHFLDVGLKGVVHNAFDVWTGTLRPTIGHLAEWIVALLPPDLRFHLSDFWKDYLSVGIVSTLSNFRARAAMGSSRSISVLEGFIHPLTWPVLILSAICIYSYLLLTSFVHVGPRGFATFPVRLVGVPLLWLAPLIYLAVLFVANAWLA